MNSINFNGKTVFPSKVICVGKNYAEHIQELNDQLAEQTVIFIKPNSAINTETVTIDSPDEIHYEAEISLLVENNRYVAVAFGLDLTKRQLQRQLKDKGLPWERSKAFDKSAIFSDFVLLKTDISEIKLEFQINGILVQQASYDLMLTKPEQVLEDIQSFLTLENYDVVMTGTPKGVGKLNNNDVLVGRISDHTGIIIETSWTVING
jgi:2-keto-4-pentenoate hydratase/2-oxohepta-3-ene-1,7-dioic acid hydratase in catechol pathway